MPELLQQYLVFLVLTFLLCSTANTLIWRSFSSEVRGILDWLMLFFLVVAGLTLLILGTIGFMGHFNVAAQIAATLVVFGFGGLRLPFLGRHFQIGSLEAWNKLRHLIFRQQTQAHSEWVYALFGFLILFGAVELFNAFVQYPWEYDSLAYHLPIVIEWVKSESLWNIFYAAWGGPLGYYPSHHELLLSWLVLPFGNDYLVNVMNFLVLGVMVVAVYKILIELGLKEFLAWLGSALVMMMPVFLGQLGTSQVDVLLALGVLLSWYYLLRTHKRQDGQLLMPVSLSMALVLGTKYLGLFYGLPIFLVFLCLVRQ
ncbi:MAG: hypothetical protein Q8P95_00080, partial [bacterium]|nr:hypothetical protein [bacterium]